MREEGTTFQGKNPNHSDPAIPVTDNFLNF